MTPDFRIPCLVPDLPPFAELQPLLAEMHANRWFTNFGPLTRRFEAQMAKFLMPKAEGLDATALKTATFSSATTALELILKVMDLPEGGHILMPALTFPATALAAITAGFQPVFADVGADCWTLTPAIARAACKTEKLVAVMPVAAFGKPLDVAGWQQFQKDTGIPVVMDAAAALGEQKTVPDIITVFSLHATKPFGVGEGGLVTYGDVDLLARAQSLSNFGFRGTAGMVQAIGTNAKFGEYYAAVGLAQLARWEAVRERRQAVAGWYDQYLAPLGSKVQRQGGYESFVPAVLSVFVDGRGPEMMQKLGAAGIQTRHWYLPLLHQHPALAGVNCVGGSPDALTVSNHLRGGLFGLPFHAFLSENNVAEICDTLGQSL